MAVITQKTAIETWRLAFNALDSDFRTGKTVRTLLSAVDNGGLGSLSYNTLTGEINYTGPSNSDIRSLFSVGPGIIQYDSATGQFTSISFSTATYTTEGIAKFDSADFTIAAGLVSVKPLSINTGDIVNAAVTGAKIASATITGSNISSTTITGSNLANSTVTSSKLASAVTLIIYNSAGSAVKTLYGAGS